MNEIKAKLHKLISMPSQKTVDFLVVHYCGWNLDMLDNILSECATQKIDLLILEFTKSVARLYLRLAARQVCLVFKSYSKRKLSRHIFVRVNGIHLQYSGFLILQGNQEGLFALQVRPLLNPIGPISLQAEKCVYYMTMMPLD